MGKTAVAKALTSLVEKGEISGKAYGKQWVYVARQDMQPAPSSADLEALDEELTQIKTALAEKREANRQLQMRLHELVSSLSDEQMVQRIATLEPAICTLEAKLGQLQSGARHVDPAEKAAVDKKYELYSKEWKSRRRLVKIRQCMINIC